MDACAQEEGTGSLPDGVSDCLEAGGAYSTLHIHESTQQRVTTIARREVAKLQAGARRLPELRAVLLREHEARVRAGLV